MPRRTTPTHTVVTAFIALDQVLEKLTRSLSDRSLLNEVRSEVGCLPVVFTGYDVADELLRRSRLVVTGLAHPNLIFEPVKEPADRRRFEEVAHAWMLWAQGSKPELLEETKSTAAGGAMNLMAYNFWAGAVRALVEGDMEGAARLYRRVLSLGESHDIDHIRAIRWTYAASFFHRGLTSEG